MNDRERWIVYPLLFLALGAALRDKLAKQTRAKDIVCENVYLVDDEGRPQAALTGRELRFDLAGEGNGYIRSNVVEAHHLSQLGQPVLTLSPQAGLSLEQLLQLLPQQLRVVPGLPQTPPAPQDTPPGGEERPAPEAPTNAPPAGEPGPAA